jgi:feruloyl esterase
LAGSVNGTPAPFPIATDQVALSLQNPKLASASFHNATANGEDRWKDLSYSQLAEAQAQGEVLSTAFGGINTDNPDLSRFRNRRGKMLLYYGMADQLIPIQGATAYYEKVARQMGGHAAVRQFYRYYQVPGMGHCAGVGSVNGRKGVSPAADPPLPAPGQLFSALTEWVEKGNSPQDLTIHNSDSSVSRPLCEYPTRLKYVGGERSRSSSYKCQ